MRPSIVVKPLRPLSHWMVRCSSSVAAPTMKTKARRSRVPTLISTLNSKLLHPADYMDLSGRKCIYLGFSHKLYGDYDSHPEALFHYFETTQRIAFPDKCAGFLYYHRDSHAAPLEGGLRFRCTPDRRPTSFSRGHDLLWPNGIPWQVLLPQLARPRYREFAAELLLEKLAPQTQILRCRELFGAAKVVPSRILFRLGQEFPVDFASPITLTVVAEKRHRLFIPVIFTAFAPAGGFLRSAPAPTSDREPDERELEKRRQVFPFTGE
ncbi:hypothetical protein B0H16DRAFT_1432477 [Mycena metata]|uniref:Uncharacterized protein n=1 Tax=Mycena metata TaxID=1033252 RepID=A0AAD7HG66_9AGAR|nr:hypothetical protein B0H16DRAFT_1432477 [Mycena metata]